MRIFYFFYIDIFVLIYSIRWTLHVVRTGYTLVPLKRTTQRTIKVFSGKEGDVIESGYAEGVGGGEGGWGRGGRAYALQYAFHPSHEDPSHVTNCRPQIWQHPPPHTQKGSKLCKTIITWQIPATKKRRRKSLSCLSKSFPYQASIVRDLSLG